MGSVCDEGLGCNYAALVWGYVLVWFLLTDLVKLLAYRILDPQHRVVGLSKPMSVGPQGASSQAKAGPV